MTRPLAPAMLEGLHALLWARSSDGMLRIVQKDLADELVISKFQVWRLLQRLEETGRIAPVDHRRGGRDQSLTYLIAEPR